VHLGDLVKFKRSKSHLYRTSEPLGLILKTWTHRHMDSAAPSKCLVEWLIHPGSPTWYRCEELVLVSSAE
jgi:hypothetical protein